MVRLMLWFCDTCPDVAEVVGVVRWKAAGRGNGINGLEELFRL